MALDAIDAAMASDGIWLRSWSLPTRSCLTTGRSRRWWSDGAGAGPTEQPRIQFRMFYGFPGRRLVGYDNERGKGDHRHIDGREEPYDFRGWEALIDDFLADVARLRSRP